MNLSECLIAGFMLTTSAVAVAKLQFQWQQQLFLLKRQQASSSEHHNSVWNLYQVGAPDAETPQRNMLQAVQQHIMAVATDTESPYAFAFDDATLQHQQAIMVGQALDFEVTAPQQSAITKVTLGYNPHPEGTEAGVQHQVLVARPAATFPLTQLNFDRLYPASE
ncbi:hypothetical protein IT774_04840 [Salinimonas marina]|uniref:Uncharacterized protein n=1 Tax=Salinimonas marina TaxID=2785918 RepID=A0A7S9HDQ0_9ALTE|nr:hypothetical protein [Salinimonas marina]QPG06501.1 hypothetical protein IT774_04840 [Salinimonas marina]